METADRSAVFAVPSFKRPYRRLGFANIKERFPRKAISFFKGEREKANICWFLGKFRFLASVAFSLLRGKHLPRYFPQGRIGEEGFYVA